MRYDLTDLSRIPLPHADLAQAVSLAWHTALDPFSEVSDCPYGRSQHAHARYLRLVWRTVYRGSRQRYEQRAANTQRGKAA